MICSKALLLTYLTYLTYLEGELQFYVGRAFREYCFLIVLFLYFIWKLSCTNYVCIYVSIECSLPLHTNINLHNGPQKYFNDRELSAVTCSWLLIRFRVHAFLSHNVMSIQANITMRSVHDFLRLFEFWMVFMASFRIYVRVESQSGVTFVIPTSECWYCNQWSFNLIHMYVGELII